MQAVIPGLTRWTSCAVDGFFLWGGEGGKKTLWSQLGFTWLLLMAIMISYICIVLCSSQRIFKSIISFYPLSSSVKRAGQFPSLLVFRDFTVAHRSYEP